MTFLSLIRFDFLVAFDGFCCAFKNYLHFGHERSQLSLFPLMYYKSASFCHAQSELKHLHTCPWKLFEENQAGLYSLYYIHRKVIYTGRNGPLQKGENSLVKELRAGVGECSLLFSHRCNLTSRVLCTDCVGELHSHMYLSQVSFIEVQDCAACLKIAYVDVCHLA